MNKRESVSSMVGGALALSLRDLRAQQAPFRVGLIIPTAGPSTSGG